MKKLVTSYILELLYQELQQWRRKYVYLLDTWLGVSWVDEAVWVACAVLV